MTTYPTVRPVPSHIARPPYVPRNFFTDGWGDHDDVEVYTPTQQEGRLDIAGVKGVRKVGQMAAEILRQAGKLVKVGDFLMQSRSGAEVARLESRQRRLIKLYTR